MYFWPSFLLFAVIWCFLSLQICEICMMRHRGQKYLCEFVYNLCEFIHNLFLSKITSDNRFTTLLLGLQLSASFTWLLTKYVPLVCQTNHLSIYSHNFWLVDIKVVLQFTTCCLHVWLTAVFITHLRNKRLSIDWVHFPLWNIELPHFRPTCYRFQNSSWSIGFTNSNILWATLSSSTCKTMADSKGKSAQEILKDIVR